jgi:hypothetical protein
MRMFFIARSLADLTLCVFIVDELQIVVSVYHSEETTILNFHHFLNRMFPRLHMFLESMKKNLLIDIDPVGFDVIAADPCTFREIFQKLTPFDGIAAIDIYILKQFG